MNINEMANLYSLGVYSSYFLNAINGQDNTLYKQPSIMDVFNSYYSNPSDMMDSITDIQNSAKSLSEAADKLSSYSSNSIFDTSTVQTNSSAITANETGNNVKKGVYNVEVSQIAKSQVNTGNTLSSDNLDFQTGHSFFAIEKDGQKYTFDTYVYGSSTNKSVLESIANDINNEEIGLTATLNEDKNGNVSLSITSNDTGESSAFSIYDIAGSIEQTGGFSNVAQEAQNAKYTVNNGNEQESETNTLEITDDLTADVSESGKFEITVSENSEGITSSVEEFVNKLNEYLSTVNKGNQYTSQAVQASAQSIESVASTLSTIGINYNGEGFEITDKFYELAQNPDSIQSTIKPIIESIATGVKTSASSISEASTYSLSGALNPTGSYLGYGGGSISSYISMYLNEIILSSMGSSFNAYG